MKGTSESPKGSPGANQIRSRQWFPSAPPPPRGPGPGSAIFKLAIGAVVGLLFFFVARRPVLAYAVWGVAGAVGGLSLASAKARGAIDGALARFGRWAGTAVGWVLLGGVYLLVLTPVRFVRRALGADDLHLRDARRTSYWLPSDADDRKVRWFGSMFATEVVDGRRGHPFRAVFVIALMLVLAEGVLRTQGFGHTVVYVADPVVGYYPAPNMTLDRYGGRVHTNQYGMRSANISFRKPEGKFRILLLGDSTLYGGSYIDQADLYSSRLEVELNKLVKGDRRVRILAMGANGWGPFHEHGYISKFGTFDADITIVTLPVDDINRPLYGLMDVPFFAANNPPTLALEEVANHLMWRYRAAHSGLDSQWEAEQSRIGIREYGRLVDSLHRTVPEVFAAILPSRSSGLGGPDGYREARWIKQLKAVFEEHHTVATYYPVGLFAGKGEPSELYYDDVHLNPKGHAIYASFLAERLVSDSAALQRWLHAQAPSAAQGSL